jgi:hypothetical protein
MARITDPVSAIGGRTRPAPARLTAQLEALIGLETAKLRAEWRRLYRSLPPKGLSRDLLIRAIAYKLQERSFGGLSKTTLRKLQALAKTLDAKGERALAPGLSLRCGAKLVREWGGETHSVLVLDEGFEYREKRYRSLSEIARSITGAHWSGPRFFGLGRAPKPFGPSGGANHE